jgi:hypothetical protein
MKRRSERNWRFVRARCYEIEVGIKPCRMFCSELNDCYLSPDIININAVNMIINAWHVTFI